MTGWLQLLILILAVLLEFVSPGLAPACDLCNGRTAPTIRQEADQAKLVLYGTLENPTVTGDSGKTDVRVEAVLKTDGSYKPGKVITVPHYLPVDPKDPPHFLVFCDVFNGKLDPYRGVPLQAREALEYIKGVLALDRKDRSAALLYAFRYLENPDKEVANDAFQEFALANNREVGQVAPKLAPARLRAWIKDPQTLDYRLSLYAFLLGACGTDADAALLRSLLDRPDE